MSKSNEVIKIKDVINTMRFYVKKDGGDLEFISYEDGILEIEILGACVGCKLSSITYKEGLESILRMEVPEIKEVVFKEGDNQGKDPYA